MNVFLTRNVISSWLNFIHKNNNSSSWRRKFPFFLIFTVEANFSMFAQHVCSQLFQVVVHGIIKKVWWISFLAIELSTYLGILNEVKMKPKCDTQVQNIIMICRERQVLWKFSRLRNGNLVTSLKLVWEKGNWGFLRKLVLVAKGWKISNRIFRKKL